MGEEDSRIVPDDALQVRNSLAPLLSRCKPAANRHAHTAIIWIERLACSIRKERTRAVVAGEACKTQKDVHVRQGDSRRSLVPVARMRPGSYVRICRKGSERACRGIPGVRPEYEPEVLLCIFLCWRWLVFVQERTDDALPDVV